MSEEKLFKYTLTEKLDRIRLIRSAGIGPVTFHRLIERFAGATAALEALPGLARRSGAKPPRIASRDEARREWDAAHAAGAELIFHGECAYPPLLARTEDAPAFLSLRGDAALLGKRAVAVVGARNAAARGQRLAQELANDLGRAGLLVVSGLARGIDAAAHTGALETGTLAVIGGGIDIAYPRQNSALQDAIAETGALVTEARPGEKPTARHFPRRNRIIAGMARGVVVVEAAPRSGSLITARLAAEYGRDVFAVPGAAHDPRGRGTNGLLRDGAILVETADDILAALPAPAARHERAHEPAFVQGTTPAPRPDLPAAAAPLPRMPTSAGCRDAVIAALGTVPSSIDDIVRASGIASDAAQSIFTELEMSGRLERYPGGRVALRA